MLVVGIVGVFLAAWGLPEGGAGPLVVGVAGTLVAVLGLGSLAAALAGRCVGMPWQFTK
jgi:hypothetical protein